MKLIRPFIIVICLLITFTSTGEAENNKKFVLIAINELNISDFYSIPVLKDLMEEGSIGLMNTKTSSNANVYKAYTTIGAGTRAEASSASLNFLTIDDDSSAVYERRTGAVLPRNGIINIDMVKLIRQNANGDYGAVAGSLGQALQDIGKKTSVIGNSDTSEVPVRLGASISMDHRGYTDYGMMDGEILEEDMTYPFGVKSNYPKMLEGFKDFINKSDFMVIDMGDISRLERYKNNLSDEQYLKLKNNILNDINKFLKDMMNHLDFSESRIMIVSPYPSSSDIRSGRTLTPVIIYGDGISSGLLYSNTTRRTGIIGNIDLAPTVINYLDGESKYTQGKELSFEDNVDNYNSLIERESQVVSTSRYRAPVLSTFAIFEILISIISLGVLLFREKLKPTLIHTIRVVLLSTMIVPVLLLIAPIYRFSSIVSIYIFAALTITIVSIIISKVLDPLDGIIVISGVTTIFILTDIVFNANLIKMSVLGYDPIIGARYYGIGNEYMGVLIGSTLVFATALLDRFKISKKVTLFIFLLTIIIIGLPKLGANVGGTISAVAAFAFTSLRLYKVKIRVKQLFLISILIITTVAIMAFIDIQLGKAQSHLAGALLNIIENGPAAVILIINRKVSMNLRLIGVTIWSKVLISAILIIGVLFYRPVKMISRLAENYPNLTIGWTGIVSGCVVAFAVNDSGIVAAATSIIFLATSLLYLSLYLKRD